MTTATRFDRFVANLAPTEAQVTDAIIKLDEVAQTLHREYYDSEFDGSTRRLIGSYEKGTAVRPPRDVDILFVLPNTEYVRYKGYEGNGPSQLLQEVKGVLQQRYPTTDSMRGDGHVVVVNFTGGHCVEVLPAWETINGRYLVPDTHDGGSWVLVDQVAEIDNVQTSDARSHGTTRRLIKMLKSWQRECDVPVSSLTLELRSVGFLATRPDLHVSSSGYPTLVVDFFADLVTRGGQFALVPGTTDRCDFGRAWVSKAETALARATRAREFEDRGDEASATAIWKQMFGGQFES